MVIKLPRSRESTPVAVTPPSTSLVQDETFNFLVFRKIRRLADLVTTTADK